jgi:predicted nucleotidyltransferase component of viral defense system
MKNYQDTYIRQAEIAQLVILNQLYNQRGSQDLLFQGGTALRWCYGATRFSEDLDFVTQLAVSDVRSVLEAALKGMERVMIPHFGLGDFTFTEKPSRADSLKCFLNFRSEAAREKISVKFEAEGLVAGQLPQRKNHVLSGLPSVAYLIGAGDFRVPRPNAVIVAETPAEILSDKVRSLLERRYLKGRDLFDVWYLRTGMKTEVNIEITEKKFKMYCAPFNAHRSMDFFAKPSRQDKEALQAAVEQDLSRFLPPDVLTVWRDERFEAFLEAVRALFVELKDKGVRLP